MDADCVLNCSLSLGCGNATQRLKPPQSFTYLFHLLMVLTFVHLPGNLAHITSYCSFR